MGNVSTLSSAEIPDDIQLGERGIARLMTVVPVGSLALLDTEFDFPDMPGKPPRASFIDSPELGLGRDEGRHQPRFGQMIINGAGLHERPILVTVKPFNGSTDKQPDELMQREWAASNYLNSLSDRQLAYLPLGAWRTAKGVNHLISLYEHDVKSYDNVFWADKELSPEALRAQTIEHALNDCIRGLGYLHGLGLVHTDAEVKNLAANLSGIRFIDLEGIKQLPREGTTVEDSGETVRLIRNDLETLFDSTIQVDENRKAVANVLAKPKMDERLAKTYRAGLRQAKAEADVKMPPLSVSTVKYFKNTIDHTLKIANSPPIEEN